MSLLPCDVDPKVRGDERRWSVTLCLCEFPGADPATGLTSSVPRARGFEGIAARPYAVSAKSSSGRTFRSASPSTTGTLTSGVAPTRGGHLHVGDELGGVLLVAGLRRSAPRTPSPCGRCRVTGRGMRLRSESPDTCFGSFKATGPCIPQHSRHRPWGARPGVCPHGTAPAAAGTPQLGSSREHGTGPPAGKRSRAQTERRRRPCPVRASSYRVAGCLLP